MAKQRRIPRYRQESVENGGSEAVARRIPADISKQAPHTSCGGVPLDYEDTKFTCIDCGNVEVWTAEQQKWWYETAKGYIFSKAIRCGSCRQKLYDSHGGTPRRSHRDRREQSGDSQVGSD